jgi:hypothetical protein
VSATCLQQLQAAAAAEGIDSSRLRVFVADGTAEAQLAYYRGMAADLVGGGGGAGWWWRCWGLAVAVAALLGGGGAAAGLEQAGCRSGCRCARLQRTHSQPCSRPPAPAIPLAPRR